MLPDLFFGFFFLASFFMVFRYGVARAFAYVYVPATLFLSNIPPHLIDPLPRLSTAVALGAGMMLGLALRFDEIRKIRWNIIDTAMVLMLTPTYFSSANSDGAIRGIRDVLEQSFTWLVPYFIARIALVDADGRRRLLKVLCISAIVIACLTAYETRISPYGTSSILKRFGLNRIPNREILVRWGLMRAMVTMCQPIDLGLCGVLVGGMILVLIPATGSRWKDRLPLAGIISSGAMVFGSISLSAWGAMAVAFGMYYLMSNPRNGRWMAVPAVAILLIGFTGYTAFVLNTPLAAERPDSNEDPFGSSQWIRGKIIQDSWDKCLQAGMFGLGHDLDTTDIGTDSVDNAYLLFIMGSGWYSLAAWILFAFLLAWKGSAALGYARTDTERLPVAAVVASIIAIFYAMFTVFFGFIYATLLGVMIGFLGTLVQMLAAPRMQALPSGYRQSMPLGAPPIGGYR